MALRHQMDGVANNVANMNTTGFKGETVLFREFLIPNEDGTDYSYVVDFGIARDLSNGELIPTGNIFDIAIEGNGYFMIETGAGQRYTRNGHFSLNGDGVLVTADGDPVLNDRGRELTFSPADGAITINRDGSIAAEFVDGGFGRIGVVSFANVRGLTKVGYGLYETNQEPNPAENVTLHQGMLENSNVKAVVEMARMVDVSRKYQLIQRLIDAGYDLKRSAIQRLGRVQ